uniref:Transport protein n=1 Tax=Streptomyces sp. CNT-179 TaxID=1338663 RepID=S4WDX2_9ACTN|nr:transport protein [Streptomyces sp. CNT-179]
MSNNTESASGSRPVAAQAGAREWIGLIVLSLPTMLVFLDLTVMFLALPHITVDLQSSALQSLWMVDIYGFLIAGSLVTMGRLGDRIGRRRLILIGSAAFGLLSFAAAFSTSPEMVIAARAGLGVAGATFMPCTLALIRTMFPDPKQMTKAMAIWTTMGMGGLCLGPSVGGLLLGSFWWGSVFMIAVPVTVLMLLAGPALLPESRDENASRLDLASAALSLVAILSLIYGLKEMAKNGWDPIPAVACAVGVLVGVIFVRRQNRLDDPLLDVSLFRVREVAGSLTLFMVTGIVQAGTGLLIAQYLQLVDGRTPLVAALWLIIPSLVAIVGVQLSAPLASRVRPSLVLVGGLLLSAVGMIVMSQVPPVDGLAMLIIGVCISYAGVSMVPAIANQLTMQAAPPERSGSAGSLSTTSGELGNALGIAIMGSLATVIYAGRLVVPSGVPSDAASAAGEDLAGAVTASETLSPALSDQLLTAAREAFTGAFGTVALCGAVTLIVLAGLMFVLMRHVRPIGSEEPEPETEPKGDNATSQ